jgi:DNA-binding XRE family transcriptional regulator
MARFKERPFKETFGGAIRNRRRQLDITQRELARRVGTSIPYIGLLEMGKRHPSENLLIKLANVLGFDAGELFFLANPATRVLVSPKPVSTSHPVWEAFAGDENLRKSLHITGEEMEILSRVALLGEVRSPSDFVYILRAIRHAQNR